MNTHFTASTSWGTEDFDVNSAAVEGTLNNPPPYKDRRPDHKGEGPRPASPPWLSISISLVSSESKHVDLFSELSAFVAYKAGTFRPNKVNTAYHTPSILAKNMPEEPFAELRPIITTMNEALQDARKAHEQYMRDYTHRHQPKETP
ncbi:MAG: hypothetical protein ACE5EF_00020 [Dehalococcoidia bacterium]